MKGTGKAICASLGASLNPKDPCSSYETLTDSFLTAPCYVGNLLALRYDRIHACTMGIALHVSPNRLPNSSDRY